MLHRLVEWSDMDPSNECHGCGLPAEYSVLLSKTRNTGQSPPEFRLYIPNQIVRSNEAHEEVWFCHGCMRSLEDNFRATLLYLQSENDRL